MLCDFSLSTSSEDMVVAEEDRDMVGLRWRSWASTGSNRGEGSPELPWLDESFSLSET